LAASVSRPARAREYAEFARYIRENPVRRKLVDDAAEYPFSSAAGTKKVDEMQQGLKPPLEEKTLTRA
jgi:hypothetical protein